MEAPKPPQGPAIRIGNYTTPEGIEEFYSQDGILQLRVFPDKTTEEYNMEGKVIKRMDGEGKEIPIAIPKPIDIPQPNVEAGNTETVVEFKGIIKNIKGKLEENRIEKEKNNLLISNLYTELAEIETTEKIIKSSSEIPELEAKLASLKFELENLFPLQLFKFIKLPKEIAKLEIAIEQAKQRQADKERLESDGIPK